MLRSQSSMISNPPQVPEPVAPQADQAAPPSPPSASPPSAVSRSLSRSQSKLNQPSLKLKTSFRSQMSISEANATFKLDESSDKSKDGYVMPSTLPDGEDEIEEGSEMMSERVKNILRLKQKLDSSSSATKSILSAPKSEVTSRTTALESEIAELKETMAKIKDEMETKESLLDEVSVALKVAEASVKLHRRMAKPPPEASKELILLQQENAELRKQLPPAPDGLADLMADLKLEREINDELRRRLDKMEKQEDLRDEERPPIKQVMIEEQRKLDDRLKKEINPIKTNPFTQLPRISSQQH